MSKVKISTHDLKPDDMAIYISSKRIKYMEQVISSHEQVQRALQKVVEEMAAIVQPDTKRNNLNNK